MGLMGFMEDLQRPGSYWHLVKIGARLHPIETLLIITLPLALASGPTGELFRVNALAQLALFIPVVQIPAFLRERLSYVDIGWPTGLVLLATLCYYFGEGFYYRRVLACGILLLHGGRMASGALALFFPYNFPEDLPRYQYAKVRFLQEDGMPPSLWWLKIQHDTLQQCFANCASLATPFLLMASDPTPELRIWEVVCAGLWALCWSVESTADGQMMLFRQLCKDRQAVIGRAPWNGPMYFLWTLCRHPNYFCEWMCWNSFVLMALPSWYALEGGIVFKLCTGVLLCFTSRIFYDCLLFWTGAEPAEYFSSGKRPEYRKHQAETRVFFPVEVPWFDHCRTAGWPRSQ